MEEKQPVVFSQSEQYLEKRFSDLGGSLDTACRRRTWASPQLPGMAWHGLWAVDAIVVPISSEAPFPHPCPLPQGQKRLVLSESCSRDSVSSQPSGSALNSSYGVNAWKSWVQAKYVGAETSKGDELRFGRKAGTCG